MYTYVDGNNNTYRLNDDDILSYDPITPAESSSGVYSGGTAASIRLETDQASQLRSTFDSALAQENSKGTKRTMGSSILLRAEPRARTVLPRQSGINIEISKTLQDLLRSQD